MQAIQKEEDTFSKESLEDLKNQILEKGQVLAQVNQFQNEQEIQDEKRNSIFDKKKIEKEALEKLKKSKRSMLFISREQLQTKEENKSLNDFDESGENLREMIFFCKGPIQENEDDLIETYIRLDKNSKLKECVGQIIMAVNSKIKSTFQLQNKSQLYEFYLAKKNGFKKESYPAIWPEETMNKIQQNRIYIQFDSKIAFQKQKSKSLLLAEKQYQPSETLQLMKKEEILQQELFLKEYKMDYYDQSKEKVKGKKKQGAFQGIFHFLGCCSTNNNQIEASPIKIRKCSENINDKILFAKKNSD